MDWNFAIDKHRDALKGVLAMLVAMAGFSDLDVVAVGGTLPRHLHRALLALLRPAEAAARRLVIVSARGLVVEFPVRGKGTSHLIAHGPPPLTPPLKGEGKLPHAKSPSPLRGSEGRARPVARPPGKARGGGKLATPPRPGFRLFDPLPRWNHRIRHAAVPRISVPGVNAPFPVPPRRVPSPHDPIGAARLASRLKVLAAVLDDLPRHARRFARWKAARNAAQAQQAAALRRRTWPLRPGRPPGHPSRRSRRHPIHAVLDDVHGLAVWTLEDTS